MWPGWHLPLRSPQTKKKSKNFLVLWPTTKCFAQKDILWTERWELTDPLSHNLREIRFESAFSAAGVSYFIDMVGVAYLTERASLSSNLSKAALCTRINQFTYSIYDATLFTLTPHHPWLLLFLCFYSFYLLFLRSIWYTFLRIQSEMVRVFSWPAGEDCTAFQMQIGAPFGCSSYSITDCF